MDLSYRKADISCTDDEFTGKSSNFHLNSKTKLATQFTKQLFWYLGSLVLRSE